jgi:hypothetical protein
MVANVDAYVWLVGNEEGDNRTLAGPETGEDLSQINCSIGNDLGTEEIDGRTQPYNLNITGQVKMGGNMNTFTQGTVTCKGAHVTFVNQDS